MLSLRAWATGGFAHICAASVKLFNCLGQYEQLLGILTSHYFEHSVLNPIMTVLDRVYSGTLDSQKLLPALTLTTGSTIGIHSDSVCRLLELVSGGSAFLRVGKAKCIKITFAPTSEFSSYIFVAKEAFKLNDFCQR